MGRRFKWHMFFTSFLPLWVSMVLFDNESVVIHDRLPLGRVPRMTEKEYFTRGCTALLDAVGGAIHHIGNIHMLIVGYNNTALYITKCYCILWDVIYQAACYSPVSMEKTRKFHPA